MIALRHLCVYIPYTTLRCISTTPTHFIKAHKMPPRPKIIEDEITEVFLKGGSGPGGQKINKCNSKVQLKHIPTGIVVTCQATRSREQNRKKAREILAMKVQHLLDPQNSRQTKLEERKIQSAQNKKKKSKKKYSVLNQEKRLEKEEQERQELEFLQSLNQK